MSMRSHHMQVQTRAATQGRTPVVLPAPQRQPARPNPPRENSRKRPERLLRTQQWLPVQQDQQPKGQQEQQWLEQWGSQRQRLSRPVIIQSPAKEEPDYAAIDARPHNQLIQTLFRSKMARAVGGDAAEPGFDGVIALARRLNEAPPQETQARTVDILKSLFPSWLLPAFKVMFSRPMPAFACKLNAWATALTCEWLMGPCKVSDVEVDGGKTGVSQGVEVQRCRYLEQAGCTSVCVNSCKVPTQTFFAQEMGLPVTMTPNYEDFSCIFAFGKTPPPQSEDPAFASPCLSQCPSRSNGSAFAQLQQMAASASGVSSEGVARQDSCHRTRPAMEDTVV